MNRRRLIYLILIGLGLVMSGYLLFRSLALMAYRAPDAIDLCSELLGVGCDEALLSASSWFLGIPLAGWGVVYYLTLACLLVLGWLLRKDFELEAIAGSLLLAVMGACGSVFLVVNIIAGRVPFCPLCLVIHTINLALVPVIWWMSGRSAGQLLQALRAGGIYLLRGQTASPRKARWKVLGFVTVALFALLLYQWIYVEVKLRLAHESAAFDPGLVLFEYASAIPQGLPISAGDPHLGTADLPVRLVVFSSFQCPGCRNFSSTLHKLASRFEGQLTVVFKHFPLGSACNPMIRSDMHSWACLAAWAAEASHQQGQFWPYHDALFATDTDIDEDGVLRIARDIGLDPARFEDDRKSESTKAKVRSDIDLGIRLGIDSTPAVFLNGRRVRNLSLQALEFLIENELKTKKSRSIP